MGLLNHNPSAQFKTLHTKIQSFSTQFIDKNENFLLQHTYFQL
jgi:hypothetical protein